MTTAEMTVSSIPCPAVAAPASRRAVIISPPSAASTPEIM